MLLQAQLVEEVTRESLNILNKQLGVAAVVFVILLVVFYFVWKDMRAQREILQKDNKDLRELHNKEITEANAKVERMLDRTLELSQSYTQTTMELSSKSSTNEMENIKSLNDVTTAINNLHMIINELRNDRVR